MTKWKKITLEECCHSITDGDHQSMPVSECGVPFIIISNIKNNRIDFEDTRFVPVEYYDSLDVTRKAQRGDILYTVKGSFGIPAYVDSDMPFVFQRDIAILKCNNRVNSKFLYYIMKSVEFERLADLLAIGSAQRAITLKTLRGIEILIPEKSEQDRIVEMLSPYDDLIENNQKQIKLLEEAAQRLYKEWFVDLRFPGYEDVQIVDGVPEGWSKKTVGELLGKVDRTTQIMTKDYKKQGSTPVIDQSRDFIAGYTDDKTSVVDLGRPVIVFGDHTRVLKYIQFPFAKGADGTQLLVSNSERMPQALLYCSLVEVDLSNYHYARHFKYLKAEEIIVPSLSVAERFDQIATLMFVKTQKLRDIIIQLTEARDRLLPKLMSGEIEL